jgi:hypothetical protein
MAPPSSILPHTFELLGVSLGHILKVEQSDVDMRDVVLNRRIPVVIVDRPAALFNLVSGSVHLRLPTLSSARGA